MTRPARLDSLTGLRFLAALLVFGSHFGDLAFADAEGYRRNLLAMGRIGVSFFYVLSGFVLTWAGSEAVGMRAFYQRRIARIVPNHVVTWAIALVTIGAGSVLGQVLALPLLHAWSPRAEEHFAANPVSWSLSVEAFFYAVFPFAIVPLTRLGRRARMAAGATLVLGVVAAPFVAGAVLEPYQAFWAVYLFPVARLPEFLLGVVLALAVRDGQLRRIDHRHAAAVVVAALLVAAAVPGLYRPAVTIVPFALLIPAMAMRDAGGHPTWGSRRWLVRLGEWSFAFYLVHLFALELVDATLGLPGRSPAASLGLALLSLALAVAFAAALYTLVERPAERRIRHGRRLSRPPEPAEPAVSRAGSPTGGR